MDVRERLSRIAKSLEEDGKAPTVTVREFLNWFDAQRRGSLVVWTIRQHLSDHNIESLPDFEAAFIDSEITFKKTSSDVADSETNSKDDEEGTSTTSDSSDILGTDPTFRISKLAAANQKVISVSPDDPLEKVITVLSMNDFSQAPVMCGEREVKGIVSWESIGTRLALEVGGKTAKDLMETHHEIRSHSSLFDAIDTIIKNNYVLVRSTEQKISGIITASDLSVQFRYLSEPFLLLSEIENLIRIVIAKKFDSEELSLVCLEDDDRSVDSVNDMNFGEYIRLLEKQENWTKIDIKIDRREFCKKLDDIRKIRNEVMHFDPDGITEGDLETLREFTTFLRNIIRVRRII